LNRDGKDKLSLDIVSINSPTKSILLRLHKVDL